MSCVRPTVPGGAAVSEWLQKNFLKIVGEQWQSAPQRDVAEAFVKADEILLRPKGGFFGAMGERGVVRLCLHLSSKMFACSCSLLGATPTSC